jgi:hypothetical protein
MAVRFESPSRRTRSRTRLPSRDSRGAHRPPPTDEKNLLQTLAVPDKEFSLSLVQEVTKRPDDEDHRMLNDLQMAGCIYEHPEFIDIEYTFEHALRTWLDLITMTLPEGVEPRSRG